MFKKFAGLLKEVTNKIYFKQGVEESCTQELANLETEKKTDQMQPLGFFSGYALIFIGILLSLLSTPGTI